MEAKSMGDNTADVAVKFEDVSKWYGGFRALNGVNLSVGRGERIVICGPSGSGKSTLIRCVNALERHGRGHITVNGIEVTNENKKIDMIRQQVGMVFQSFNLFPHMTALENCTLALRRAKKMKESDAEKTAMHFLERTRIPEQASKYPSQLSGGQQQRVAIARALCLRPQIMLFDEPTSALDPEMVREVLDAMIELASDGMTMICVTHEMGFARQFANRIVFMDSGSVVESNSPDLFFSSPENDRTKAFLSQIIH